MAAELTDAAVQQEPCGPDLRCSGLAVVLENPSDLHNIERILRSCRAFGVQEVCCVLERRKPADPRTARLMDLSSIPGPLGHVRTFGSTAECMQYLTGQDYHSAATTLDSPSVSLYESEAVGLNRVAFWFGQERHGLTDEAVAAASSRIFIPTVGMVQSLNVATSVAVVVAEAFRHRAFGALAESRRLRLAGRPRAAAAAPRSGPAPAPGPLAPERLAKFRGAAARRQRGLVVVLENPDRLDAGAILRSCDAFGVAEVHFVFEQVKPFDPLANRQVYKSEGSNLWVCSRVFGSVADCSQHLVDEGYTSVAVLPSGSRGGCAVSFFEAALTGCDRLALWLGNGPLSEGVMSFVDAQLFVSEAGAEGPTAANTVAVALAEVVRQRASAPEPGRWRLEPEEQAAVVRWCVAVYLKRHPNSAEEPPAEEVRPEYRRLGKLREELAQQGW